MPFVKIFYTYGAMLLTFLAVDLLWLGVIAKNFYKNQLGELMRSTPNWTAAIIFYALFLIGIMVFCIIPAIEKDSLKHALLYGAMFGFFTYMTYELTNLAVIKDWPPAIVPVDIIWGVVLATTVSLVGYFVGKI